MTRLIDADALKETFRKVYKVNNNGVIGAVIDDSPTVDAVPVRHGKWTRLILGSTGYGTTVLYQCSECESLVISRFRYCPDCGARMDEE